MHDELRYGEVFGIITAVSDYDALLAAIQAIPPPVRLAYAHFDILLQSLGNAALQTELRQCSLVYLDGVGARMAFRLLHGRPVARINATDIHHRLLTSLALNRKSVAMIGGLPEAGERLRSELLRRGFPEDRILVQHGYHDIGDLERLKELERFHPDAIFLGMGTPKQFDWMRAHREANLAPIIVATGGFLDFLAGTRSRAPQWMRSVGIEWLHRLLHDPARLWKRYLLGIPRFLFVLLRERYRTPRR